MNNSPALTASHRKQPSLPTRHPYRGWRAVLATMHEKLPLIAPAMHRGVGLDVYDVAVDTDQLGTFTGDVARTGTPWDTAIAKARLGMNATGSRLGLASEGSIGPSPSVPFLIADVELVVVVDDELGIIIGETATQYDIVTIAADITPGDNIETLLQRGGFPEHGLTVKPAGGQSTPLHKGIHDHAVLDRLIGECATVSSDGRAHLETDLRAHHCPSRRPIIAAAACRLAERLAACCPTCTTPGWGIVGVELGVPCEHCGLLVQVPNADIYACASCDHEQRVPRTEPTMADPSWCEWCNP